MFAVGLTFGLMLVMILSFEVIGSIGIVFLGFATKVSVSALSLKAIFFAFALFSALSTGATSINMNIEYFMEFRIFIVIIPFSCSLLSMFSLFLYRAVFLSTHLVTGLRHLAHTIENGSSSLRATPALGSRCHFPIYLASNIPHCGF
jgi:hypothetical protein